MSNKTTVYMFIGIPGCGKSYFVENRDLYESYKIQEPFVRVNLDSYREQVIRTKKLDKLPDFNFQEFRYELTTDAVKMAREAIAKAIDEDTNIVLDNMNLKKLRRFTDILEMKEYARLHGKELRFIAIYFEPDLELSLDRVSKRAENTVNKTPIEFVKKAAEIIEKPTLDEGYSEIITVFKQ